MNNISKCISKQTLRRLPYYLDFLKSLKEKNIMYISSPTIAKSLNLNEIQVRKDLAGICESKGIPKRGFIIDDLIKGIRSYLGYDNANDAVLVGAGRLGRALLDYEGFLNYGLNIVAGFDSNNYLVDNKKIFRMEKLPDLCMRLNIKIGIITTPSDSAQEVCDLLIESGICAIWNFAPVYLNVPKDILVHNENMAASLSILSNHLKSLLDI